MFCTTIAGVPARKRARCRCTSRAYPSTPPPGGMPTMILMVLPANDAGSARADTGAAAARASINKERSPTARWRTGTALLRLGGLLAAGLRLALRGAPVPAAAFVAASEQGAEHGQQGDAAGQRGALRPPTLGSCACCHEARPPPSPGPLCRTSYRRFPNGFRADVRPKHVAPAAAWMGGRRVQSVIAMARSASRSRAVSFSLALLSWPQAARMSRPRGVRTGEA